MALYFVTGSLGGGKSLCAMSKVDEYLRKGRKIATNMNINLEWLCNPDNDYSRVIRVPDAPSVNDLAVIGLGSDKPGDGNHGLLVLDELGTWFNARDFGDKSRKDVIKFCIHLRKLRWDVLFLVQDFSMVDKQMRGNITQFLVTCQSSKDFWMLRPFPKFHIATIRLKTKLKTGTWWYRSSDLYNAYDTEQLYFTTDSLDDDMMVDEQYQAKINQYKELNGLYSLLPPKYLGDEVRNAIRARHAKLGKSKSRVMVLAALIFANAMMWPRSLDTLIPPALAVDTVEEGTAVPGETAAEQPQQEAPRPLTWAEQYGPLRVKSHSRFGRRTHYTFTHPDTGYVTDVQLADAGVRLKPEGRDQVTLISPTGETVTVYR